MDGASIPDPNCGGDFALGLRLRAVASAGAKIKLGHYPSGGLLLEAAPPRYDRRGLF
jgi:hypothetical protein